MHNNPRPAITRNREVHACAECRRRRVACDRKSPCGNCSKRGGEVVCKYQTSSRAKEDRERRVEAESRLQHLEQLVQELAQQTEKNGSDRSRGSTTDSGLSSTMSNGSTTLSDATSNAIESTEGLSNGTPYKGATHWSAMLEDIDALKDNMASPDDHVTDEHIGCETTSTDIIFGYTPALHYEDVLARYLPPRSDVDRYIAAYFRSASIRAPFIHSGQFSRQYTAFWESPPTTPPLWTSILFSICHIGSKLFITDAPSSSSNFAAAAAHCLIAGRYNKANRFAAESLLLLLQAQCLTGLEVDSDTGMLFGLLMRLLKSRGYHRDPDNFSYTPFEGEMRRRTWSLALQLDLLISFQLGLPSTVQYPTWNTRPPTSLLDADFDEDCQELPPARPDTVATDILFYITKHRLMTVFEKVLRHALSPDLTTEPDELDAEVRATYSTIPQILRPRPLTDSVVDTPSLTVTRLCVHFIYAKSLCVLHRPHALQGQPTSIRICYEASTDLLRHFCDAYTAFQPGGQYEGERWFLSSITWNDFLLASMVLCLVVCVSNQKSMDVGIDHVLAYDLIRKAHSACADRETMSGDTRRVKTLLEATIRRFGGNGEANGMEIPVADDLNEHRIAEDAVSTSLALDGMQLWDTGGAWDDSAWSANPDLSWSYLSQYLNLPDEQTGSLWAS